MFTTTRWKIMEISLLTSLRWTKTVNSIIVNISLIQISEPFVTDAKEFDRLWKQGGIMFITYIRAVNGSKKWEILSLSIVSDDRSIHSSMKSLYFNPGRENEFITKRDLKSMAIYLHRKGRLSLPNTLELNVKTTKFLQPS